MGGRTRSGLALAAGSAVVLLAAAGASADSYVYRFTSVGQWTARRAVLLRSDLPDATGWSGGSVKPGRDANTAMAGCDDGAPRQPLVVTGAKETSWTLKGFTIETRSTVFRSPAMARADWTHRLRPSRVPACVRDRANVHGMRFESARKLPLPHLGPGSTAVQIVLARGRTRMVMDVVGFTHGRTKVMLATEAPVAAGSDVALVDDVSARVAAILENKLCGCVA